MRICIAGKNSIAIEVCRYVVEHYPLATIYALTNRNETGEDNWQRSYLKYINSEPRVLLSSLDEMYSIENLIFLSVEYDRIIHPDLFKTSCLYNIHFSLLPAYKGVYPSVWPILNGEKYAGVTLHKMDRGIDTGDIIKQTKFKLSSKETSYSLYMKLILQGTKLVIKNIEKLINGNFIAYPQPANDSTYYSKASINYSNLSIDLNATAEQIDRQIRAFYFPAYQVAHVHGYAIVSTKITTEKSTQRAGAIVKETDKYIMIATIDYNIKLYKQQ